MGDVVDFDAARRERERRGITDYQTLVRQIEQYRKTHRDWLPPIEDVLLLAQKPRDSRVARKLILVVPMIDEETAEQWVEEFWYLPADHHRGSRDQLEVLACDATDYELDPERVQWRLLQRVDLT